MKNIILMFLIFGFLTIISCKNEKTNTDADITNTEVENLSKVVGNWSLVKMDLAGEIIPANVLANPTYSFYKNGTYLITASGQSENGTWKEENGTVNMFSKELDKKTTLTIKLIDENNMVYQIGDDDMISTIYLKK